MKANCRECTLFRDVDPEGRCWGYATQCSKLDPSAPAEPPVVEVVELANPDAWWVKTWGGYGP